MNTGIFYLYTHSKIYHWKGKTILESDFRSSFSQWKIPKKIRYLIVKEMECMGLLKRKGDYIELVEPMFNEDDCNLYFEKLGLYKNGK
jgi:hypothetical protein